MTVKVNHSTSPDGSFSVAGAAAWQADHALTGVGTMAEQDANNVNITGGSITGVSGIGTVTAVTGVAPITSSGGATPAIGIPKATTSVDGYLSATDWTTFNNKLSTAVTSATAGTGMSVSASTGSVTFTNTAPDQVVALTDGTAIDVTGTYPNFTITNTAPDQVVSLTGAGTTSISGTYPNFTITSNDSKVGDVVGPASATDNAIARYDSTTGKLLQNSVVLVGDTGVVTGVTELTVSTKVVSPHFDAQNSAGGSLRNASGVAQLQWGGGGGNNLSVDVAININPANSQVDLSPTGTGTVRINPATASSMNNVVIGATTPLAITGTTITATNYVGVGGGNF